MELHTAETAIRFGKPLQQAAGAMLLLHGRGSSAREIIALAQSFSPTLAFLAPSAAEGTWYPQRFLAPLEDNEPWLTSALSIIGELLDEVRAAGIPNERIGIVGFSQGACLALEYAVRNPQRYALVAGLSGALIGPLDTERPHVDLSGIPVLLGCAERDAHIPLEYVEKSATILYGFGASVTKHLYPGSAHTVFPDEIEWIAGHLPKRATAS